MRPAAGVLLVLAVAVQPAAAQVRPEVRGEYVSADQKRVEVGGGFAVPMGSYLRAGTYVTHDVWSESDSVSGQWRAESLIRFLLDPLAEQRYGLSFGAGLGYRERPYFLVVAELEGPRMSGVRPAVSCALGGGLRFALSLRFARGTDRR